MICAVRSVAVFCGSNPGRRPEYADGAVALALALVAREVRVVYGGARVGMMGMLADAALAAGGEVVGVIPRQLLDAELAHPGLSELHVVGSMHERKALMAELSDGFVAPPGGIGTLEEFAEVTTWSKLGLHAKPTGLLNVLGYYDRLLGFLDHAVDERFLRDEHRGIVLTDAHPDPLLDAMERWTPPVGARWIDAGGRAYDPERA